MHFEPGVHGQQGAHITSQQGGDDEDGARECNFAHRQQPSGADGAVTATGEAQRLL